VDGINEHVPADQPRLFAPDLKFRRSIGEFAGKTFSVKGEPLSVEEYHKHLAQVLPTSDDEQLLSDIFKERDWVLQMN